MFVIAWITENYNSPSLLSYKYRACRNQKTVLIFNLYGILMSYLNQRILIYWLDCFVVTVARNRHGTMAANSAMINRVLFLWSTEVGCGSGNKEETVNFMANASITVLFSVLSIHFFRLTQTKQQNLTEKGFSLDLGWLLWGFGSVAHNWISLAQKPVKYFLIILRERVVT